MNITTKATSGHQHHEHATITTIGIIRTMRNLSSSNRWEWERGARRFHVSSSSHFLFLLPSSSLHAWQATGSSEVGCCSGFCFFFAKEVGAVMLLHTRDFPEKQYHLSPSRKERNKNIRIQKKSCKSWVSLTRRTYSCFLSVCQTCDVWLRIIPKRSSGSSM